MYVYFNTSDEIVHPSLRVFAGNFFSLVFFWELTNNKNV